MYTSEPFSTFSCVVTIVVVHGLLFFFFWIIVCSSMLSIRSLSKSMLKLISFTEFFVGSSIYFLYYSSAVGFSLLSDWIDWCFENDLPKTDRLRSLFLGVAEWDMDFGLNDYRTLALPVEKLSGFIFGFSRMLAVPVLYCGFRFYTLTIASMSWLFLCSLALGI